MNSLEYYHNYHILFPNRKNVLIGSETMSSNMAIIQHFQKLWPSFEQPQDRVSSVESQSMAIRWELAVPFGSRRRTRTWQLRIRQSQRVHHDQYLIDSKFDAIAPYPDRYRPKHRVPVWWSRSHLLVPIQKMRIEVCRPSLAEPCEKKEKKNVRNPIGEEIDRFPAPKPNKSYQ